MPEIQSNPEFYSPWPLLGKRLNFQWGNIRQDIAVLKAIARAQVQDVETGDDFINADRILSGLEFGELTSNTVSFKNKFRLFYNKTDNTFCIQYNSGSENSPTWVDYLCIDEATGMVTVVGLTAGILGTVSAYKHTQATPSSEWTVNHSLNSSAIIVQTFNTRDRVIQFDEADTSNLNIAYFYFVTPQTGSAVLLANHGSVPVFTIEETDGNPPAFETNRMVFDSSFFYLSSDSAGDPVVSFRDATPAGEANTASNLGAGAGVFSQKSGVDLQFKSLVAGSGVTLTSSSTDITITSDDKFYGMHFRESDGNPPTFRNDTLIFDSESFYLSPNSVGKPVLSFRGTASGGLSSITVGESDGNPPDFTTDTVIFNSGYFYLSSDSFGDPVVSIREDNILVDHVNDFDIHKHVSGFYAVRDPDEGFITRINWKNGDFNIVNRNNANTITSILGKHYRKTFTRDSNGLIIEINYTRV